MKSHVGLSLSSVFSPLDGKLEIITVIPFLESPDKTLDIRVGFLEYHATNRPNIAVCFLVSVKEVICENSSRGNIPGVTRGTPEIELEFICCAAFFDLWIPPVYIVVIDNLFKPLILMNQLLHVCPDLALLGSGQ